MVIIFYVKNLYYMETVIAAIKKIRKGAVYIMNRKRRVIEIRTTAIILVFMVFIGGLTGCGKNSGNEKLAGGKYSVVCTIFPQYDWVRQIIGQQEDNYELTLLLDKGVDLHNYQPTAADIAKIANCDMFIYVGGESDEWVEDVLKESTNKDMIVINLLDILGDSVKEEEFVEGMEGEEDGEDGEEEGLEYDEHVWLSLKNAGMICKEITESLSNIDSSNSTYYQESYKKYVEELNELDKEYKKVVEDASFDTILFGDRFPFRYLVDDYSLNYYAAFVGCSAETEASFETIVFLSEKVDELKLPVVFVIESSDRKIAKTVINNTQDKNQEILVMNSMQSITSKDVAAGTTYLSVIQENLNVLKQGLN